MSCMTSLIVRIPHEMEWNKKSGHLEDSEYTSIRWDCQEKVFHFVRHFTCYRDSFFSSRNITLRFLIQSYWSPEQSHVNESIWYLLFIPLASIFVFLWRWSCVFKELKSYRETLLTPEAIFNMITLTLTLTPAKYGDIMCGHVLDDKVDTIDSI